jgi:DNA-binding PadR family transcriptional regulator
MIPSDTRYRREKGMEFDSELVRGVVEPVVLRLLAERRMYGYEIIKVVNERTKGSLAWKEGTLYPCLHRMESSGLIKGEWQEAGIGGRQRKYYALSAKGRALLKTKTYVWSAFSTAVNAILCPGAPA